MSNKVRVAIIGVGNCASSFIQGLEYYKNADPNDTVPGLMHVDLGGYHISDIEISAAFDIDREKVGKDVSEAIFSGLNNTVKFSDVPRLNIPVQRGMTHDGLGKYLSEVITKAPGSTVDIAQVLKDTGTDVVVNYLPVGSEAATRWYTEQILEAPCAMVNCMPVFIAREDYWQARFRKAGMPIIGDDIKSQVGATIVHRVLTHLFRERGVELENTYQLNFGGNTDFLNMLERERLMSKKISKTNSVQSQLATPMEKDHIHIGPSDYVPWLNDRKWAFIRLEGKSFGDVPLNVELKLEVHDFSEQCWDRHRRGAVLQARARPWPQWHARRPGVVLHEVTAPPGLRRRSPPRHRGIHCRGRHGRRAAQRPGRGFARSCGGGTRHTRDELTRRAIGGADSVDAGRRRGGQGGRAQARCAGSDAAVLRVSRRRGSGGRAATVSLVLAR